ncbi:SLATT domain-containing protein [Photobacterium sp. S4TG1]|uniref:SLATT domain-containing protein n=1 Tax=Photobacterium sp. S4TG1 TaxID=3114587 RepID=UPI002E17E944|nr:SLATT domain-containing protein [Photobacterium sp. S4TG1]
MTDTTNSLNKEITKLENQIWFTRKSRIRASERILSNHFHSNAILIWYSFLTFVLSIILIKYPKYLGDNADVLMTIATGFVFTLSLFVPQLEFKNRSDKLKENYIKLQSLIFELKLCRTEYQLKGINSEYLNLLYSVENHKTRDLLYFIIFDSDGGCERKLTFLESIYIIICVSIRLLILLAAYVLPPLIIYCW